MRRIPVIRGLIDRRILVNYRIDPAALRRVLPAPFRPQLVGEAAVGGICLIRLTRIRPRGLPALVGIGSENAAHRFAVEWDEADGERRTGVYIPRRDTSSWLNAAAGGRLFPGVHHRARFEVEEGEGRFHVAMTSGDGARVVVDGQVADALPEGSIFGSLADASRFFEEGSLGYSPAGAGGVLDGLELRSERWEVEPLAVERVESTYFEDGRAFAPGAVELDHALLMRRIPHEWHGRGALRART